MPDLFDTATPKTAESYSAKDIEVLEGLEPVRRRPGCISAAPTSALFAPPSPPRRDRQRDGRGGCVAGHATRIEIELAAADGCITVRDNGRVFRSIRQGHPRFLDKSALEIIPTMLHSGGKFGGEAYKTRAGCTASASR